MRFALQWTPLNGITLGQTLTDPINQMMLISKWASINVRYDRQSNLGLVNLDKFDSINQLVPLYVIPSSNVHCIMYYQVIVIERRDDFSRNNVLKLWKFLIDDLKSLGAKKFFGKFCTGNINHCGIRFDFASKATLFLHKFVLFIFRKILLVFKA